MKKMIALWGRTRTTIIHIYVQLDSGLIKKTKEGHNKYIAIPSRAK